jgi:hypothetical protein
VTAHRCPHCICRPDPFADVCGAVNRDAEFFPLVVLIDSLSFPDQYATQPGRRGDLYGHHLPLIEAPT